MVHATAVEGRKGGRLRIVTVGGGRDVFIGAVHRMAMRLDDLILLKADALSVDAENARASGADLGLAPGVANVYRGAGELISARRAGRAPAKTAGLTPNVVDGARGVAFIEAAVKSSRNNGEWTSARLG